MTDKKDDRNKGPFKPGEPAAPLRPHATIDLKATEVIITNTASGPAGAGKSVPMGAAATVANAAQADVKTATHQGAAEPRSAAASQSSTVSVAGSASLASPAQASAGRRHGFAALLGAGLTGGVLAVAGSTFLMPLLGLGEASQTAQEPHPAVARRLTALEQAARERPQPAADASVKIAQTEARLGKLEDVARGLGESQTTLANGAKALAEQFSSNAGTGDVAVRIQKLEEQLGTIAAAANDPQRTGRVPQLAQIAGKLADLEGALATATTTLRRDVAKDVETRVAATNEASEAARSGTQRLDRDLAGIKTDSTRLSQRAQTLELSLKSLGDDTATLKAAIESLRGDLGSRAKPDDVKSAMAPVAARIETLEKNVLGVVKSEQDRNANAERIVLSLELANLKRALDRGGKFSAELAAVKKVAGTTLNLAPLEAAQNDNVPTLPALGTEFRSLANAMLDIDAEPADASVVDRLLSGAKSIVRVRKVSHAPGDTSTEAGIARIEAGLKDGRLGDVITEAKKLPPKILVPAQTWLKRIEARHAVDSAVSSLEAQLKSSLTGGVESKKGNN